MRASRYQSRIREFLRRAELRHLAPALLLLVVGIVVQWSVGGVDRFPVRHTALIIVGMSAAVVVAAMPVRAWRDKATLLFFLVLLALVLVLVAGRATNNARRWIDLGFGFKLQPSEFYKGLLLVLLARHFDAHPRPRSFRALLVPFALLLGPSLLIVAEPDLGTTLSLGPVFLGLLWLAGAPRRVVTACVLLPLAVLPLLYMNMQSYQRERVDTWLRQDRLTAHEKNDVGYHLHHAKLAVGAGGLDGYGWGNGPENRLDRLPERQTDFVFPVVAEEFGLLGASAVLAIYAWLIGELFAAAYRFRDLFSRFFVAGVALHFATHAVINIGVALGVWPTTGLPLPLVSWGGSSMLLNCLLLGMVVGLGGHRRPVFEDRAFSMD